MYTTVSALVYYLSVYGMEHENYVDENLAEKIWKVHGLRNTTDYVLFS